MKTYFEKVEKLINNKEMCPLPLEVIPNNMGINLCSVDSISWQKRDDGQLTSLTIYFIPTKHVGCDIRVTGTCSKVKKSSKVTAKTLQRAYPDCWNNVKSATWNDLTIFNKELSLQDMERIAFNAALNATCELHKLNN